MYKRSNYLIQKFSKKENSYFVYHSILGNLTKLDISLYNYIFNQEFFSNEELKNNLSEEEFNILVSNSFIKKLNSLDEQEIIKNKLKNRKENISLGQEFGKLQLILTNSCNFNCKYCFCNHFSKEKIENFMSFEIAEKAILNSIKILKKNLKPSLTISFFGGEPSLNFNVIENVILKFENFYDGINIDYEYTSNGSIMTQEIASLFSKYKVKVSFSIDYLNKDDLSYRGGIITPYPWEKIENNIKILAKNNVNIEVASVLSTETFNKDFYFLVDTLKKYNVKRILLILSFDSEFYKVFSTDDIIQKVFEYYLYCFNKGIALGGYWYETFSFIVDSSLLIEREAYKTCPSIGRMLSIEPNGKIFACKTLNKNIGDIFSLPELFKSEEYSHYAMRAYINSDECIGCQIQGFCSGNCAGANENNLGSIYKVDPLFCSVMKGIVNKLLDFYIEN